MFESYEKALNHKADFKVAYKFRSAEKGGRKTGMPSQGIRCDFSYVNEHEKYLWIIWPEFEDKNGKVILDKSELVPRSGIARMWIMFPKMRKSHYEKIKIGAKGFFREGKVITADCEIIEILDLRINPII